MLKANIAPIMFQKLKQNVIRDRFLAGINSMVLPLIGILIFAVLWASVAKNIDTSLGEFPGPTQVWEQSFTLIDEHNRQQEKAEAFYERQEKRNAKRLAVDSDYVTTLKIFTGAPTFFDQIWTSLYTVTVGFFVASIIAVPLGILCGLSKAIQAGLAISLVTLSNNGSECGLRE
jgi:nitrate/nitrite transport system permease protein